MTSVQSAISPRPDDGCPQPNPRPRRCRGEVGGAEGPDPGEVLIEVTLRQACDEGRPFVAEGGDSTASKAFLAIAETVLDALDHASLKPPPSIVFED